MDSGTARGNLSQIHANIEDALGNTVWRWPGDLPRDISDEGHHADAITLSERLAAVCRDEQLIYDFPLLIARTGDRHQAISLVESNLAEFPDEPSMLLPAGQALEMLGENDQAESAYRDALTWVGFETSLRDERHEREGRADAAEKLRQSEQRARREVQDQRARAMGMLGPRPIRRENPKTGRKVVLGAGSGACEGRAGGLLYQGLHLGGCHHERLVFVGRREGRAAALLVPGAALELVPNCFLDRPRPGLLAQVDGLGLADEVVVLGPHVAHVAVGDA